MEWIQAIWSSEWSSYYKGDTYLILSLIGIVRQRDKYANVFRFNRYDFYVHSGLSMSC
jgi:hypothetical protein